MLAVTPPLSGVSTRVSHGAEAKTGDRTPDALPKEGTKSSHIGVSPLPASKSPGKPSVCVVAARRKTCAPWGKRKVLGSEMMGFPRESRDRYVRRNMTKLSGYWIQIKI